MLTKSELQRTKFEITCYTRVTFLLLKKVPEVVRIFLTCEQNARESQILPTLLQKIFSGVISTDGQYCASGQYYAKIKTLAFAAQTSYFSIFFSPKTPTFPREMCTSTDTFLPKKHYRSLVYVSKKSSTPSLCFSCPLEHMKTPFLWTQYFYADFYAKNIPEITASNNT